MVCPKCGGTNILVVNQQHVSGKVKDNRKTKGFGGCKSCLMTCVIGPMGFFCGLCGMGKTKGKFKDTRKYTNDVSFICLDCGKQFKQ